MIVDQLSLAAQRYTRRNLRSLFDTINTLAEVVGPPLGEWIPWQLPHVN